MRVGLWKTRTIEIPWSDWLGIHRVGKTWVVYRSTAEGAVGHSVNLSHRRAGALEHAGSRALERQLETGVALEGQYVPSLSTARKRAREGYLVLAATVCGLGFLLVNIGVRGLSTPPPPIPRWIGVAWFAAAVVCCGAWTALVAWTTAIRHRHAQNASAWAHWRLERGVIHRTHADGRTDRVPIDRVHLTSFPGGHGRPVDVWRLAGDPVRRGLLLAELERSGRRVVRTRTRRNAAWRLILFWPLLTAAAVSALAINPHWAAPAIIAAFPCIAGLLLLIDERGQRRALTRELELGRRVLHLSRGHGGLRHTTR